MTSGNGVHPLEGRCNARLRGPREGKFCQSFPLAGKKRCKMHGGRNAGVSGPRNGRYSHGAFELLGHGSGSPTVRADALLHLTPEERARLVELEGQTELEIARRNYRIATLALERTSRATLSADAFGKMAAASARLGTLIVALQPQRVEVSGPGGGPLEIASVRELLVTEIDRTAARLLAPMGAEA